MARESRGSVLALRERYLWLWRQMQRLEVKLSATDGKVEDPIRRDLWTQRMKIQLKRYWP